jgi:isopentenyl-diphosphate Delta-isomerase
LSLPSFTPPEDLVVLVDEDDRAIGEAPKLEVHERGLLHRAVSLLLRDQNGRFLLQRRAEVKYHSGGLWSNTCCGHPRPGESNESAALRRLRAEMGILECNIRRVSSFLYRTAVGNGLVEHEVDHVLVGEWSGEPSPDPSEVAEWRWISESALYVDLAVNPHQYTPWLAGVLLHSRGAAVPA